MVRYHFLGLQSGVESKQSTVKQREEREAKKRNERAICPARCLETFSHLKVKSRNVENSISARAKHLGRIERGASFFDASQMWLWIRCWATAMAPHYYIAYCTGRCTLQTKVMVTVQSCNPCRVCRAVARVDEYSPTLSLCLSICLSIYLPVHWYSSSTGLCSYNSLWPQYTRANTDPKCALAVGLVLQLYSAHK